MDGDKHNNYNYIYTQSIIIIELKCIVLTFFLKVIFLILAFLYIDISFYIPSIGFVLT